MYTREEINKIAFAIEDKFGSDCLLKLIFYAINNILVTKGICTEDEIFIAFVNEIETWKNQRIAHKLSNIV